MPASKKYTNDEIAAIIELSVQTGYSTFKIGQVTGMNEASVRSIINRHYKGIIYGERTMSITIPSKLNKPLITRS